MPPSLSTAIQSERTRRRSPRALTSPASWIAPSLAAVALVLRAILMIQCDAPPPCLPGEGRDPSCATHGIELGGESPLRAARSGTDSQRQLRRSDAGWGGSRRQIGEPTNRHRIQSLPLRKQGASAVGQPDDGRGRPILLPSHARVNPAAAPRKCSALPWETSSALRATGAGCRRRHPMAAEGSAEAIVGPASRGRREGLNL